MGFRPLTVDTDSDCCNKCIAKIQADGSRGSQP